MNNESTAFHYGGAANCQLLLDASRLASAVILSDTNVCLHFAEKSEIMHRIRFLILTLSVLPVEIVTLQVISPLIFSYVFQPHFLRFVT